jgi:RNA polymerase sigma factor (sigma-70 family)
MDKREGDALDGGPSRAPSLNPGAVPVPEGAQTIAPGFPTLSEWSSSAVEPSSKPADQSPDGSADERYGRLYRELQRPARAMVRRAFGTLLSDSEIEDAYSGAWLGTLRALRDRGPELSDEELRKYVLTAVANHASKELRRRGRKPTAPLDHAREVADAQAPPDERAASSEQSQVAREILSTLPPRRRAVMMLRYGWGLTPDQVCGLVKGLSHRAYRKEVTRGVDEVSAKLRLVEEGRWCDNREPVLKAYAAGIADVDQRRQAEQHLAHCRHCTEYVGKLSGHLHEIGSSIACTAAAHAIDDRSVSIIDRVGGALDRARDAVTGRGVVPDTTEVTASQVASSGAGRGAGAASASVLAKVAGAGAVPKLVAACLAGGAAATCVAAGVLPGVELAAPDRQVAERRIADTKASDKPPKFYDTIPVQAGHETPVPSADDQQPAPEPDPSPAPAPEPEPAPAPPPAEAEFDVAAAPSTTSSSEFGPSSSSAGGGSSSAGAEFGGP